MENVFDETAGRAFESTSLGFAKRVREKGDLSLSLEMTAWLRLGRPSVDS